LPVINFASADQLGHEQKVIENSKYHRHIGQPTQTWTKGLFCKLFRDTTKYSDKNIFKVSLK